MVDGKYVISKKWPLMIEEETLAGARAAAAREGMTVSNWISEQIKARLRLLRRAGR
jgi:predicted HicB family RNase H-like nuclease